MRKDLKKNKKGFTLVEIIVVLLIIGILLAITIPSIMGYVSQANDAKYLAQGRSGYVAANTITARQKADGVEDATIASAITAKSIGIELGEFEDAAAVTAIPETATIKKAYCTVENNNIGTCYFETKDSGASKLVKITNNDEASVIPSSDLPNDVSLKTGFETK